MIHSLPDPCVPAPSFGVFLASGVIGLRARDDGMRSLASQDAFPVTITAYARVMNATGKHVHAAHRDDARMATCVAM